MSYGANYVHQRLRENLEQYIKSQYFGRSPLLLNAVGSIIDRKGELYQDPYIESSNAYEVVYNGIRNSEVLPEWLKDFLIGLSSDGLGKYETPYTHQLEALESFYTGKDIFVSTGTGSGKTECFMWPMIAKMADEAYNSPDTWERHGVRTITSSLYVREKTAPLRRQFR